VISPAARSAAVYAAWFRYVVTGLNVLNGTFQLHVSDADYARFALDTLIPALRSQSAELKRRSQETDERLRAVNRQLEELLRESAAKRQAERKKP
jgi:hypothetical protein